MKIPTACLGLPIERKKSDLTPKKWTGNLSGHWVI
jgi:hypothetical protein